MALTFPCRTELTHNTLVMVLDLNVYRNALDYFIQSECEHISLPERNCGLRITLILSQHKNMLPFGTAHLDLVRLHLEDFSGVVDPKLWDSLRNSEFHGKYLFMSHLHYYIS